MRKNIVAGNWKMNLVSSEAKMLLSELNKFQDNEVVKIVFPPSIFIHEALTNNNLKVGAQNFYPKEKGAYTGEVSMTQLKDIGVSYVLVGHSERRMYFSENEAFLKEKVNAALSVGLKVVFCCGEPLEIRESNKELSYVKQQLIDSLFHLPEEELQNCIIAYEPIWAIGTGRTASVEQAEDMHASIRSWVKEKYGSSASEGLSILYGGSCNAKNAKELFSCPNVDGGLIGGASLDPEAFISIAKSF